MFFFLGHSWRLGLIVPMACSQAEAETSCVTCTHTHTLTYARKETAKAVSNEVCSNIMKYESHYADHPLPPQNFKGFPRQKGNFKTFKDLESTIFKFRGFKTSMTCAHPAISINKGMPATSGHHTGNVMSYTPHTLFSSIKTVSINEEIC